MTLDARSSQPSDDERPSSSPAGAGHLTASHEAFLAEIAESGAWLRLIWDSAPDAMALSDADGIVLLANPAYCALFGYALDEVVGASFALIFPPEQREMAAGEYRRLYAEAAPIPIQETWIQRKDGGERFVQARAELMLQQGRPRALLSIIRDITERKRAEEALQEREERLHMALTLAPVMVFTQDTELRYTWAHTSIPFSPLPEMIIGKTDDELMPPDEAAVLRESKRRVLDHGERMNGEISLTVGNAVMDISYVAAPLRDSKGTITGLIAASIDISDYRTLERRQRQFLAMAAHELRTPVTSILGFAQLLQRRNPDDRAITTIVRQASSLDRLISDLVDGARLEDGRLGLRRSRIDLVALVHDLAEQLQPISAAHPIRIEALDAPLEGVWDGERLGQVILNLLTNAVKYAPGGGEIVISVQDLGSEARIVVQDSGVGIPSGLLSRLFEPFYRIERTAQTTQGLGLGLSISKSLVEAHGGQIVAESAGEGQGSRFVVTLPREPSL